MCSELAPSVTLPAARDVCLLYLYMCLLYFARALSRIGAQTAITGPWDAPAEASGPSIGSSVDLSAHEEAVWAGRGMYAAVQCGSPTSCVERCIRGSHGWF
jgi:hypothetical protein